MNCHFYVNVTDEKVLLKLIKNDLDKKNRLCQACSMKVSFSKHDNCTLKNSHTINITFFGTNFTNGYCFWKVCLEAACVRK